MVATSAHKRIHTSVAVAHDSARRAAETIVKILAQYRQARLENLICDFVAERVDDLVRRMRAMAERIALKLCGCQ